MDSKRRYKKISKQPASKTKKIKQSTHRPSFSSQTTKQSDVPFTGNKKVKKVDSYRTIIIVSKYFQNQRIIWDFQCPNSILNNKKVGHEESSGWFKNEPTNRMILIDWLNKVCMKFKFSARTMCLSVRLLDCVSTILKDDNYESRLMMLLSLSIATKLVERPMKQLNLISICEFFDYKFSIHQIVDTEHQFFESIGFNANKKTAYDYLVDYLCLGSFDEKELSEHAHHDSIELLLEKIEINMLNLIYDILNYPKINSFCQSSIAASVIVLTRLSLNMFPWPEYLPFYLCHSLQDLSECINAIKELNLSNLRVDNSCIVVNSLGYHYMKNSKSYSDFFGADQVEPLYELEEISYEEQNQNITNLNSGQINLENNEVPTLNYLKPCFSFLESKSISNQNNFMKDGSSSMEDIPMESVNLEAGNSHLLETRITKKKRGASLRNTR